MNIQVVCLQQHPELIDQCVDLLNSQWPRSKTARLRSLQQYSSKELPTSLVLIEAKENKKDVIGHCKISPVPHKTDICFVESVVISLTRRGKGLGKLIMNETEKYVKTMGFKTIYLTTYDQQEFYGRLGYSFCEPIQLYGGASPAFHKFMQQNQQKEEICERQESKVEPQTSVTSSQSVVLKPNENGAIFKPPPPPPPPPASLNLSSKPTIIVVGQDGLKVTMRKTLT